MAIIEITKDGRTIKGDDETTETQYQKAQRLRKENKKSKKLGFQKKILEPTKRKKVGLRGGSIATTQMNKLEPEEFDELLRRVNAYIPEEHRPINEASRTWDNKACTLIKSDVLEELMSPSPDKEKIKQMFNPMHDLKK